MRAWSTPPWRCVREDDDEDSMADSVGESEEAVSARGDGTRECGSSDSDDEDDDEPSAAQSIADVQLAVWALACKPLPL